MALLRSIKIPKHTARLTAQMGGVSGSSASLSVTSSQSGQLLQLSAPKAPGHEKAPGVITGRFHEMEREKRLERLGEIPEEKAAQITSENPILENSQGASHELHKGLNESGKITTWRQGSTSQDALLLPTSVAAQSPELRELVSSWLQLNPTIQASIMSIVRTAAPQNGPSIHAGTGHGI